MDPDNSLLTFYSGLGPDDRGRFLHEIQNWPDEDLEITHDYIQWLFPLRERSAFNLRAPILDAKTIAAFRANPKLRTNFKASFIRILTFYGFTLLEDPPVRVIPASSFPERAENWLTPGNHNYLRITRILKSLRLLGLEQEALAFFRCLSALYHRESAGGFSPISHENFEYWRDAAADSPELGSIR